MPKLWNDTIAEHRASLRDAVLDATAVLVRKGGLASVTMSQIAEDAGIGRATLYKYFPDISTIMQAWHERQIASHLGHLFEIRDHAAKDKDGDALAAVIEAYALISFEHHDDELAALLHRGKHVADAQKHLTKLVCELIAEGAKGHKIRNDVAPEELTHYCLHALTAASGLRSIAAVHRLVSVTLAGLRPRE